MSPNTEYWVTSYINVSTNRWEDKTNLIHLQPLHRNLQIVLMEKARIFISYKRKNKKKVFSIVNKIESQLGVKCWIDLDGIESSSQFRNKICNAIDNSDIVLFMHSSPFISKIPYNSSMFLSNIPSVIASSISLPI